MSLHRIRWALIAFGSTVPGALAQAPIVQLGGEVPAVLGDVNGDGVRDFATGTQGTRAVVSVYSGRTFDELYQLSGDSSFGNPGRAIAGIGDVDGDGRDDLLIGQHLGQGRGYVYSGGPGSLLYTVSEGLPDFDHFGYAVSAAGDLNGDSVPDFWVGAFTNSQVQFWSGAVRACSGADGSMLYEVFGHSAQGGLGFAIASLGDLDGDGVRELVAGAPGLPPGAIGRVEVRSGASGSILYRIRSKDDDDLFGRDIANVGDRDGDGKDDFLVAAVDRARMYSGASGALLLQVSGGTSVSGLGDVDIDGVDDFAVYDAGSVRVLSGTDASEIFHVVGVSGWIADPGDADGDGRADLMVAGTIYRFGECQTFEFCPPAGNSAGPQGVRLAATGSLTLSADNLGIQLTGGPPAETGFLAWSQFTLRAPVPFGEGWRCIGAGGIVTTSNFGSQPGGVVVVAPFLFDSSGAAHVDVPLNDPAMTSNPSKPPSFQAFYRDTLGPGGTPFNASSGLTVTFCP